MASSRPKRTRRAASRHSAPGHAPTHQHDLLIAGGIIATGLLVLLLLLGTDTTSPSELERRSSHLAEQLATGDAALIHNGELDLERIESLSDAEYEQLRRELGITGEFCLVIEDADGRVMSIRDRLGIGNSHLIISGVPCGTPLIP